MNAGEIRFFACYLIGATGTGKSTLMDNLSAQDLERGEAVVMLDPHGDLHRRVLDRVPDWRRDDVVVVDPPQEEGEAPRINPLDLPDDGLRRVRAAYLTGEFLRLFHQLWDVPEAFGPMFELYFRNALVLLMRNRRRNPSLADFPRVFSDEDFRAQLLHGSEVPSVTHFWRETAVKTSGDISLQNVTPYITSKLDPLINGGFLSEVLSGGSSTLSFEEVMDRRKILLVNLNKGLLGAHESRLLGMILMTQLFSAGLGRAARPEEERTPCHVYVDEFQNFVTDGMAEMLGEVRKFGLRLTLANQTLQQLNAYRGMNDLEGAVLGNVGNLIAFRLGVKEAASLEPFTDPFPAGEMQRLSNFHAFARILDGEGPREPVIMRTLRDHREARGA